MKYFWFIVDLLLSPFVLLFALTIATLSFVVNVIGDLFVSLWDRLQSEKYYVSSVFRAWFINIK